MGLNKASGFGNNDNRAFITNAVNGGGDAKKKGPGETDLCAMLGVVKLRPPSALPGV